MSEQTTIFTPAQRAALLGLFRCGGTMLIEVVDGHEINVGAASAVACLAQCLEPRYVTHEQISESCGKYSLTRLGKSAAQFLDGMESERAGR
jgi:hypothetical protein